MSEVLDNSTEQVNAESVERNTEQPPFDPQAAEMARKQRIAEYKTEHPDAIEDVDEAHTMAISEDPYRTGMDDVRNAVKFNEYYLRDHELTEEQKEAFLESANRGQALLDRAEKIEERKGKPLNEGDTLVERVLMDLERSAGVHAKKAGEEFEKAEAEKEAKKKRMERLEGIVEQAEGTTKAGMEDVINVIKFNDYYLRDHRLTDEEKEAFLESVDRGQKLLDRAEKIEGRKGKPFNNGETLEERVVLELKRLADEQAKSN